MSGRFGKWYWDAARHRWRNTLEAATSATPVPDHLAYEEHRDAANEERADKWDKHVEPEHGGFGGRWDR